MYDEAEIGGFGAPEWHQGIGHALKTGDSRFAGIHIEGVEDGAAVVEHTLHLRREARAAAAALGIAPFDCIHSCGDFVVIQIGRQKRGHGAGRSAAEENPPRIDAVLGGIGAQPAHRRPDILIGP